MLPLLLNALLVTAARISMPGTGAWIADLDVDLDLSGIVPTGKATFTVGTMVMLGTIDSRATGKFGSKAHVQLVAGGGGWDKMVPALHLHNPVAVLSTAVYSVTAASVGEVVVDVLPKPLGTDFVRTAGPASRVLAGVDWYVDPTGVTFVGPRVPIPFNPLSVEILEWDPATRCATLASDELVMPGTVLLDLRFGTATVRDVEQTFGAGGARVKAWCTTSDLPAVPGAPATEVAGSRMARALGALARESVGLQYLRRYRYRAVIQDGEKRVTLQSVKLLSDVPEILLQVEIWPGLVGASVLLAPGTEVAVVFLHGDTSLPIIVGFAPSAPTPLEISLTALHLELLAPLVSVGVGGTPAAKATELIAWATNVNAALSGLGAPVAPLAPTVASTKLMTE